MTKNEAIELAISNLSWFSCDCEVCSVPCDRCEKQKILCEMLYKKHRNAIEILKGLRDD